MLKGIPSIISPELLKILDEMGHGDEIVIGDGNFPAASMGARVVRADGHGVPELLDAILKLFPLDAYVDAPVIWDDFKRIVDEHGGARIEHIERFAFYERAKKAYAIIASGESAIYANVILKKGVVKE